ncbi:MAG: hypothetical protein CR993_00125 [Rhodobacterales bacterium]|nr:MAG: hypothetical protein CR993_00125 [Rhodobacterales bacterium]
MDFLEQVADELASDVLEAIENGADEDLIMGVKKIAGETSTTLEEAYMTAVRVRRAERRARAYLARFLAQGGG